MAPADCRLTPRQLELSEKYCLENYVARLKPGHENTREEIFALEEATRGQVNNNLWKLLRVNRKTASKSSCCFVSENEAMKFGVVNEELVKQNRIIMDSLCDALEDKLKIYVKERVLNCGLFLSKLGIFSASPDAYFILADDNLVVLEVKCPYTFRNENLNSIRASFNNRARYRIPNTAFSINKSGPLQVRVEKKNDHYRQMQSQLYVTGAVMAVYLVMIGGTPEVHFVERDQGVIQELRDREMRDFNNYLKENARMRHLAIELRRLGTFKPAILAPGDSERLARDGLYYWYGNIVCYFCKRRFEKELGVDAILSAHTGCDKTGNVGHVRIHHLDYINQDAREGSLIHLNTYSYEECLKLAEEGHFHDKTDGVVKLFCCGGTNEHTPYCDKHVRAVEEESGGDGGGAERRQEI
jgi:hypothetical protein